MEPPTNGLSIPREKWVWQCDQTAKGMKGMDTRVLEDLSRREQTTPTQAWFWLRSQSAGRRIAADWGGQPVPSQAPKSRAWGPGTAAGWLPQTMLGASFHC